MISALKSERAAEISFELGALLTTLLHVHVRVVSKYMYVQLALRSCKHDASGITPTLILCAPRRTHTRTRLVLVVSCTVDLSWFGRGQPAGSKCGARPPCRENTPYSPTPWLDHACACMACMHMIDMVDIMSGSRTMPYDSLVDISSGLDLGLGRRRESLSCRVQSLVVGKFCTTRTVL